MRSTIRIAHLDDHPAILAGFEAITAATPDLAVVGAVRHERDLLPLVHRTHPHVVVMDLHHEGRDGLELALAVRHERSAPAVVMYSATVNDALVVAAALAGAATVVAKSEPAAKLLDAIRMAALNPRATPHVSGAMRREAAGRLDPSDHAILAMRLAGEGPQEIAQTLRLPSGAVSHRIATIIAQLGPVASFA